MRIIKTNSLASKFVIILFLLIFTPVVSADAFNLINTSPTSNSVNLQWDANGFTYFVVKLNDSINLLTIPRPIINASNIRENYADAYQYVVKNPSLNNPTPKVGNFWLKHNQDYLYFASIIPNDNNVNYDYVKLYFNTNTDDGDAPQYNDGKYEMFEEGYSLAYRGNGTDWVSDSLLLRDYAFSNVDSENNFEMRIPLSQVTGSSNPIRFAIEVGGENGSMFYPFNVDTTPTNTSTWALITYREENAWDTIGQTNSTSFLVTGLQPFSLNYLSVVNDDLNQSDIKTITTLDENGYNISGYLLNPHGILLNNILSLDNFKIQSENGYYSITNIVNGSYNLSTANQTQSIIINGEDVNNANFIFSTTPDVLTSTSITSTYGNFFVNTSWDNLGLNTTSFKISVDGIESYQTESFINVSSCPHCWTNVTVTGFNDYTQLEGNTISLNTQIPNNPIGIIDINDSYTIMENQPLFVDANISDEDLDNATFEINSFYGYFNTTTGVLSWTPTISDHGTFTITITTTDGLTYSSKTFVVTVIDTTPSNIFNLTANGYVTWNWDAGERTDDYAIKINGVDVGHQNETSYSLDLYSLLHNTYTISITGHNHSADVYGDTAISSQALPNRPISISGILPSYNLTEGEVLTIDANCYDEDNDTCYFTKNFSKGFINSNTGFFTWQTTIGDAGLYNFQIGVNDGFGSNDYASFYVNLTHVPLTLLSSEPIEDAYGNEGIAKTFSSYFNRTANVTWKLDDVIVKTENNVNHSDYTNIGVTGNHVVMMSATNGFETVTNNWNWFVHGSPILLSIGNKTVNEGSTVSFTMDTIPDGDATISYSTTLPIGTLDSATGFYTYTPNYSESGTYTGTFTATDNYGLYDSEIITITVLNSDLVLTDFSPSITNVRSDLTMSQNFSTNYSRALTVVWYINGMPIKTDENVLSSSYLNTTPSVGNFTILASASDGIDIINKSWNWRVFYVLPPSPYIIGWNNNKTLDASLSFNLNEFDTINLSASANQSIDLWIWKVNGVDKNNNNNEFITAFEDAGVKTVTVQGFNDNGATQIKTFLITIIVTNHAPQVTNAMNTFVTLESVVIVFDINQPNAITHIDYSAPGGNIISSTDITDGATRHISLSGLSSNVIYSYTIKAYNSTASKYYSNTNGTFTTSVVTPTPTASGNSGGSSGSGSSSGSSGSSSGSNNDADITPEPTVQPTTSNSYSASSILPNSDIDNNTIYAIIAIVVIIALLIYSLIPTKSVNKPKRKEVRKMSKPNNNIRSNSSSGISFRITALVLFMILIVLVLISFALSSNEGYVQMDKTIYDNAINFVIYIQGMV